MFSLWLDKPHRTDRGFLWWLSASKLLATRLALIYATHIVPKNSHFLEMVPGLRSIQKSSLSFSQRKLSLSTIFASVTAPTCLLSAFAWPILIPSLCSTTNSNSDNLRDHLKRRSYCQRNFALEQSPVIVSDHKALAIEVAVVIFSRPC